ncbi:choice-of-anchor Q domain-containing protein, partial [Paenibacillus sp. LjRoot153]|uniref:choice-of-anchor Q domain-containing protein n=1 Tax=Paenibacillus sp. LjRoot153 TaxID=3342270 RepID=UPI003F50BFDF
MYNGKILFIESHGRRVWTVSLCLMIMLCLVLTFQPSKAHAIVNHIYVATTGSDTYPAGDGSPAKPYATIYQASTVATPGTIVHVAPGTYTAKMTTTASGNSTDRISYVSDTNPVTGARARIIPPTSHTTFDGTIWVNRGNYVDIDGFEIDGTGNHISNGIWNGGHHVTIKNNHVHHIEYMYGSGAAACNGNGGSGINISDFYQKYETPPVRMVGTVVTNNIVNSIGDPGCNKIQGIYISTTATVSNNIIYDIGAAGIHQWHDATANVIVNNTITDTDIGILIGAGDGYVASWPVNTDNNIVSNNIVYKNRQHGINNQLNGSVGTHNTYDSNLVYGNTILDWRLAAQNTHLNTVADEPEFVNYAGHDFHLQSDSKAINAGVTANAPSTDFEGNSRVGKVDIGAYENQVSTTKTLTFYHHDSVSTTSGNASGVWYKQALVDGVVVWEADVTDLGTAWRSETVNFTTSGPSFTLKFRL